LQVLNHGCGAVGELAKYRVSRSARSNGTKWLDQERPTNSPAEGLTPIVMTSAASTLPKNGIGCVVTPERIKLAYFGAVAPRFAITSVRYVAIECALSPSFLVTATGTSFIFSPRVLRSEEHTSELQSR